MPKEIRITTLAPSAIQGQGIASFKPRTPEGMPERHTCYIQYSLPTEFSLIYNDTIRSFAIRAYEHAMELALKSAVRDNKDNLDQPALADCFLATKREFLLTKADLTKWADTFALPIIAQAIAAKAGVHAESPKVIAKCKAYKESILNLSARSMMQQQEIDALIKVVSLIADQSISNAYTDNVAQGIARKQERLNAWLAEGKIDSEDDLDF